MVRYCNNVLRGPEYSFIGCESNPSRVQEGLLQVLFSLKQDHVDHWKVYH